VGPFVFTASDGTSYQIDEAPGPVPIWLTLFSSMFMHGGWLHIGGNMLFLFIFGDNIERAYGHLKYVVFYLVCGIIAGLAHVLSQPDSIIPSLGASGAISGVMAAYLVLFPTNRIRVLLTLGFVLLRPVMVPAIVMIGVWALLQFVNGLGAIAVTDQTSGVAYWAHIGGFVAGIVITFLARPFLDRGTAPPSRVLTGY
jgi:membrane associated rhomboid family serine protease